MQPPRSNQLDYDVEDDATVIDAGPHWSIQRASLARMPRPQPPLPPPPLRRPAATLPAPLRAPAFYSYAEEAARQHLDTERVAPLAMSDLESPWIVRLAAAWQRFAAPACGLIAGLILVVGYLASSSPTGAIATAPAPTPAIILPVEAAASTALVEDVRTDAPPVAAVATAEPVAAPPSRVPAKRVASKKRAIATASRSKRGPIRIDASTPLGNLRPSRSF